MNKNLKKVISSVVALALSLGSLSAFAASYTDVAETATYATAVNELSALGIVNGYDDGTFKPDQKVTRAEVTKMVVAALAQTAAADAAMGATAFADVTADHWASGYINVGSNSSGFINGMGDGTFAPEANVTYAQLVKMLVTSLGYGGMALQEGGYPTGYITVGDRIGVTKSVVANANDELTREQVARLIDNSINLPLLVTTVWSAANPEYEIKDGKGKGFQSLLTEYHDTYKVEGKIIQTSKSDTTLENDEARFEIAVADRFDDDDYFTRTEETRDREEVVIVADGIDATAALFSYSTALIYKNSDDEFELISLNSSAKSKTVELAAGAFDDENSDYRSNGAAAELEGFASLNYYATDAKTGKVTEYKIANGDDTENEAELWVNGVALGDWTEEDLQAYIVDNKVGTVTLVDAPQGNKATTDGYYDYVLVSYYKSAVVSDVMSDGTVYFDVSELVDGTPFATEIEFDEDKVEDDELQYTITLDGKEIAYTDLQEDDVVAIAYDVTEDFEDSSFYDVIVTRGTVEGKVTSEDTDDETYTVSGTTYKYDENLPDGMSDEAVGMDVTLYVDAFGRIVMIEESSSSKKFAILENVWMKTGEDVYYAKIVLPDGTTKEYELKEEDDKDALAAIAFTSGDVEDRSEKNPIEDRVITYKVNSSNLIHSVSQEDLDKKYADDEYVAKSNKIDSVKLNDNTNILDASEYEGKVSDLKTVSSLVDETKYTAYGYDKLSDGTYSFVIITSGIGSYTDDTQLAVFVKSFKDVDSEGDSADAISVLYNGEEKSYIIDGVEVDDLNKGDVIVFKTNSSDEIDDIVTIANLGLCDGTSREAYDESGYVFDLDKSVVSQWTDEDSEVELDFGVIVDKTGSDITLTTYGEDPSTDNDVEYEITDDTKVYVYSYKETAKNALFVGNKSNIVATSVQKNAKDDDDNIDWSAINEYGVNYALVKAVDDEVTEIVVIIAPGKEDY